MLVGFKTNMYLKRELDLLLLLLGSIVFYFCWDIGEAIEYNILCSLEILCGIIKKKKTNSKVDLKYIL